MNPFPLTPFLTALATDGISVTLHDYDRISLALQAEGPWTVERLRHVLVALLRITGLGATRDFHHGLLGP